MKSLNELSKPEKVTRKILEKDVQKQCVAWARAQGYWARKFSSQSQRSVPDYIFSRGDIKFAVEFKAPGKTSTDAQREEQEEMVRHGWIVFECDAWDTFKEMVDEIEFVTAI